MAELLTGEAIAQTYNTPRRADPYGAAEEYRQYQSRFESSQLSDYKIAKKMEIPRGRVRGWKDGSKPDVVRAIEVADGHGWFDLGFDDDAFEAFNRLIAGVFSGGSISEETFLPSYSTPLDTVEQQVRNDLETVGVGAVLVNSMSGNVEEIRPERDASVLGRVLVALGAPHGQKAKKTVELPAYLDDAPLNIRTEFVRVYVANRGSVVEEKGFVQLRETRPLWYHKQLADMISSVIDADVTHGIDSVRVHISVLDELGLQKPTDPTS